MVGKFVGIVEMLGDYVENLVETVENSDFHRIYCDNTSIIKEIY
jgi:hypothetical protein